MNPNGVKALLESAVDQRIGSGIAASYGKIGDSRKQRVWVGRHSRFPGALPITQESFFDLASLTKILATTLLCMHQVERGSLSLDSKIGELLTHRSGLPAWRPFYEAMRTRFGSRLGEISREERSEFFFSLVNAVSVEAANRGRVIYSDLGFLHLERLLGADFEKQLQELYSQVPGLELHYRPASGIPAPDRDRYVMTEICPWRGPLQGEVHDDNAWSKGGVAGHAGLFGRIGDLERWVDSLFAGVWVSHRTLREFSRVTEDAHGSRRAFGFDVPALDGSGSTGTSFSSATIGHLGFTGASLWMDLDRGEYAALLVNRVHPVRSDDRIRDLRREFHERVKRESR